MDEGVIEGGKNSRDAEDEFTWRTLLDYLLLGKCMLTFANLRAEGDVLGGGAFDLLLGRHDCGVSISFGRLRISSGLGIQI